MELSVGDIRFIAPDTLTPDDFVKWIDQLLLRLDKLTNFAVTIKTGQASATSTGTTPTATASPTSVQVV